MIKRLPGDKARLGRGGVAMAALLLASLPSAAQDGGTQPPPANVSAAQAEAREIARNQGNCTPGKIEVLRYALGRTNETVFKIACTERKETFVLVQCRSRICTLLR